MHPTFPVGFDTRPTRKSCRTLQDTCLPATYCNMPEGDKIQWKVARVSSM